MGFFSEIFARPVPQKEKDRRSREDEVYEFRKVFQEEYDYDSLRKLYDIEMKNKSYSKLKSEIKEFLLNGGIEKNISQKKQIEDMMKSVCVKQNEQMGPIFKEVERNNVDAFKRMSRDDMADQFGFCFVDYAMMLKKEEIVKNNDRAYDVEMLPFSACMVAMGNYRQYSSNSLTDIVLEKFDTELITSKNRSLEEIEYETRQAGKATLSEKIVEIAADKQRSLSIRKGGEYRRAGAPSDVLDTLSLKKDEANNVLANIRGNRYQRMEATKNSLMENYNSQMTKSKREKFAYYKDEFKFMAYKKEFIYKLYFLLISNPMYLKAVMYLNDDEFSLISEGGWFWYLPNSIIEICKKDDVIEYYSNKHTLLDEDLYYNVNEKKNKVDLHSKVIFTKADKGFITNRGVKVTQGIYSIEEKYGSNNVIDVDVKELEEGLQELKEVIAYKMIYTNKAFNITFYLNSEKFIEAIVYNYSK